MCDCRKTGIDLSEACLLKPRYLKGLTSNEWGEWLDLVNSKPRNCRCYSRTAVIKVIYKTFIFSV